MAWLDSQEPISHLLRGAYHEDLPSPPHSEAVFGLLLLIVVSAMLLVMLTAGPMHLWYRIVEALHLKRRAALAARNPRTASASPPKNRAESIGRRHRR